MHPWVDHDATAMPLSTGVDSCLTILKSQFPYFQLFLEYVSIRVRWYGKGSKIWGIPITNVARYWSSDPYGAALYQMAGWQLGGPKNEQYQEDLTAIQI